jgi:type I restriction enzyme S subunit
MEYKRVKISEICSSICSGGTPKSTIPEYYGGNIPWLNTKEINFNRIYNTEKSITKEGLINSSAKWIEENSVVVAMYGATAGKSAITKIPLTTNQACCNITVNNSKADYRFVYYALYNDYKCLASLANGGAQQNLNAQLIKDFDIPNFPLNEQIKIANLISTLDDKIELNRRINDNLEQQAQALFKSWFVDFEPFKDGKFVDSELGMIPEGWKVCAASDIFDINIGKTPPRKEQEWFSTEKNQNVTWVSISDMGNNGMFISDSSEYLTKEAVSKFNIIIVPNNTILLSFKLTIGRVAICNSELTTNEAIARFYLPNDSFREYLYLALKDYDYTKLGSTSSIATAVNSKIIKNMLMLSPGNKVIQKFSSLVNPLFETIKLHQDEICNLSLERDTLLPKLMSGELKINDLNN